MRTFTLCIYSDRLIGLIAKNMYEARSGICSRNIEKSLSEIKKVIENDFYRNTNEDILKYMGYDEFCSYIENVFITVDPTQANIPSYFYKRILRDYVDIYIMNSDKTKCITCAYSESNSDELPCSKCINNNEYTNWYKDIYDYKTDDVTCEYNCTSPNSKGKLCCNSCDEQSVCEFTCATKSENCCNAAQKKNN